MDPEVNLDSDAFMDDDDDDADWGESFEDAPPKKDSRGATIVVGLKANPLDNQAWDDDFLLEEDEEEPGMKGIFLWVFLSNFSLLSTCSFLF